MDSGYQNLKKQLAFAVRSIQWSYVIFWSTSATEQRSLEWGDGYYNGDIKTRKTIQSVEMNADQMSLQRSEQLRELYLSLSASETKNNPQANRRPSAALSPEDLTDAEWYYMVCMSFVFDFGEGLPGRVLANGQPIWLCNAHYADSKVFSRSLLAKSASIQTVVCFPFLQGVIELGATDLVLEDLGLIQHIKTTFLENPYPLISDTTSNMASTMRNEHIVDTTMFPVLGCEDVLEMSSPSNGSNNNEFDPGLPALPEDYSMFELSNCVHHSMDSTDCISEAFADPVNKENKPIDTKFTSLDISRNDTHYQNILSDLLKTSHQLIMGPRFQNCNRESSFVSCKKVGFTNICCQKQREGIAQKLLKKILFEVPRMYSKKNNNNNNTDDLFELSEENATDDDIWKLVGDDVVSKHVPVEKLNEKFLILESLVPSIGKVDKISILDDTIEYLLELERKVEELESLRELSESEATRTKQKSKDIAERTSDNYGSNKVVTFGRKPLVNKRKANCGIHEIMEPNDENDHIYEDNTISVGIKDKDVLIEFKCPWREGILVEIMDTVSNLRLDAHSVQSSTTDGILSLRIKSKYKGPFIASADMIKQLLHKMVWKS